MRVLKALCCATAIVVALAPGARADEWNKKTYLTFSGPVQIPGATLPAGTYMFQLAAPDTARHVIMVSSKDGSKIYGMFMTIPNDRLDTPDENVVMFSETPAGTPQAVQAWWYPGDRIGEEFIYPKDQAVKIAKANHKSVLATETTLSENSTEAERSAAVKGSVGRVDENGNMTNGAATNTAESVNAHNNQPSAAATTTADKSKGSTVGTTAEPTTAAPSNTVDGRDMNSAKATTAKSNTAAAATTTTAANTKTAKSSRKSAKVDTAVAQSNTANQSNTAVGTSGQKSGRKSLPRTASSLALFELVSALSLAGGVSIRRVRAALAK